MGRIILLTVAGLVIAGCGGTTTVETTKTVTESAHSTTAPSEDAELTMREWMAGAADPVGEIGDALIAVGEAMQAGDYATTRAKCPDLRAASDKLERTLPAPNPEVTAALQDGIDNYRSLVQLCANVDPTMSDAEIAQMESYIDVGSSRMCDAYELMGLDTNCRT